MVLAPGLGPICPKWIKALAPTLHCLYFQPEVPGVGLGLGTLPFII